MLRKLFLGIVWLYHVSKGARFLLMLTTFLGVVQVVLSLCSVWLIQELIDSAIVWGNREQMFCYGAVLGAVYLLLLACDSTRSYVQEKARATLVESTKNRAFKQLLKSSVSDRSGYHTVDLVSRVETDLQCVCDALTCTFPSLIIAGIHLLGAIWFMSVHDGRIAVFLLLLMPLFMLLARYYMRIMHRENHLLRESESVAMSFLQERLLHRNTLISLQATADTAQTYSSLTQRVYRQGMKKLSYAIASHTTLQFGLFIGYLSTLLWGVDAVLRHAISYGTLAAFLQLVRHVQQPFVALGGHVVQIPKMLVAIDRLSEIVTWDEESYCTAQISLAGSLGIRMHQVDFGYVDSPNRTILRQVSYTFAPASLHLIVGETGSGKSTLLKLFLGILQPTAGRVEVFEDQIYYRCTEDVRSNFTYVPQGNTLHSGTVRSNLLLAKSDACKEEMQHALYTAVAEFVYDLPNGLDTLCGEGGFGLSEGECQRIAIARALMQPAGILLFDEPTSALDSKTERLFFERLRQHAANKTVILVTHREVPPGFENHVFRMTV